MAAGMLKGTEVVTTGHSDEDERKGLQRNDIPPPISEHKLRRYSSCEKLLVGDSLNVAKNDKIARMMTRNGAKKRVNFKIKFIFAGESKVLFSDMVVKVNHRYKPQDRFLVISEGSLYNLDPLTLKCKRRIAISDVTHISLSRLADNFFVVHVPAEYDYLYVSRRKTEIVYHLKYAYYNVTRDELGIAIQNNVDYQIDKESKTIRRLEFIKAEGGVYTKIYAKK